MGMTFTARIDKDICMSSGICVSNYAEAFRFDADELAEPIDGGIALTLEQLRSAVGTCPSGAIELLRDGVPIDD
ncbi:ferredoxin [Mycobacterium sp. CBMA226]|nr:ferredoxin [Mycolicibacterium sp. CBMA 226]